jgi:hypothetical protein
LVEFVARQDAQRDREGPALAVPVRKDGFASEQTMREMEHEGDGAFDLGAHESR